MSEEKNNDKTSVIRINLKTEAKDRSELIKFCLEDKDNQYVAIGWSCMFRDINKDYTPAKPENYDTDYMGFKNQVKEASHRINSAFNKFENTKANDLFWTRDLEGQYWICRVKEKSELSNIINYKQPSKDGVIALSACEANITREDALRMDIGAVVAVEAYKYGLEVPGAIKASFNRPRGGISEYIWDTKMIKYSEYIYSELSKENQKEFTYYDEWINEYKESYNEDIISNLPDFDLEELVMSYIQIHYNYYLLSNSIANKSTTIKIEGEFMLRDSSDTIQLSNNKLLHPRAIVQVKGGEKRELTGDDYKKYGRDYTVFLYASWVKGIDHANVIQIEKKELLDFYNSNKHLLPNNITHWENLFD